MTEKQNLPKNTTSSSLSPKDFYDYLQQNNITFFTGVPDSLLKSFCAFVTDNSSTKDHIITPNEGHAIALATGHYLSTGKIPVVYL